MLFQSIFDEVKSANFAEARVVVSDFLQLVRDEREIPQGTYFGTYDAMDHLLRGVNYGNFSGNGSVVVAGVRVSVPLHLSAFRYFHSVCNVVDVANRVVKARASQSVSSELAQMWQTIESNRAMFLRENQIHQG